MENELFPILDIMITSHEISHDIGAVSIDLTCHLQRFRFNVRLTTVGLLALPAS